MPARTVALLIAALTGLVGVAAPAAGADVLTGWHVPWAAGGTVLGPDGAVEREREWPSVNVQALRLWDTRTAWLHLEPGPDNYVWGTLDANISAAREHSVSDITLVLWGTPRWAAKSTNPDDAPWLGPSSASPVADLNDWEEYVRMVAGRYKGVIQAYEIGNEPNLEMFFRGNAEQYGQMMARAVKAIKEVDPGATVVGPAVAVASVEGVDKLEPFLESMKGAGPDVISLHWYPKADNIDDLGKVVNKVKELARRHGQSERVWITEVGFRSGVELEQARELPARTLAGAAGAERLYWYAWTGDKIPGILPVREGSVLGEAIKNLQ